MAAGEVGGGMSDVLNDRTVRARIAHICDLCGYHILPGTRHRVYSVAYDGTVSRAREHLQCTARAEAVSGQGDDEWHADDEYLAGLHGMAVLSDVLAGAPTLDEVVWHETRSGAYDADWWRYVLHWSPSMQILHVLRRDGMTLAAVSIGEVVRRSDCEPARLAAEWFAAERLAA